MTGKVGVTHEAFVTLATSTVASVTNRPHMQFYKRVGPRRKIFLAQGFWIYGAVG